MKKSDEINNKTAVLYYRTSGQIHSSNKSFGYETQKSMCRKWCQDNGVTIVGEYFSDGISGSDEYLEKDDQLIQMLGEINGTDMIVSLNSNRVLGRGNYRNAWITREIRKLKKQLVLVENESFDIYNDDPTQVMINSIIGAVDVFTKMEISLKLHRSRRQKVKKEKSRGGSRLPLGFRWDNGKMTIDHETKPLVEEIFRLSMNGLSNQAISDKINAEPIVEGIKLNNVRIGNMLRNKIYTGVVEYGSQEVENNEFQMVSKVVFGKVQAGLNRRSKRRK